MDQSLRDDPPSGAPEAPAARIRALGASAVHRICSGQVITGLSVAVKELVENALDAGATSVVATFKEFGAEQFEVSDNGCGVRERDFAGLTAKYHTSKISAFDDIGAVASFGFRGEALSSLCEVAGAFSVLTRAADADVGARLEYARSGALTRSAPAARQPGTTVTVSRLFEPLPVRRREGALGM